MSLQVDKLKKRSLRTPLRLAAVIAFSAIATALFADSGGTARLQTDPGIDGYQTHCASCHQPGGAGVAGTFPPLAGNERAADASYVTSVITEGMSGILEIDGEIYDGVMPAVSALQGDELEAVVAYVVELAGGESTPATQAAPVDGDPSHGRQLFLGSTGLQNGGTPCASCHTAGAEGNFGGSGLGPDLSSAFTNLGGEAGLTGWLTNPPSPTMMPIFSSRAMNPTEIADLVAFLQVAESEPVDDPAVDWLIVAGLVGMGALFVGMSVAWPGMRTTYLERLRSRR